MKENELVGTCSRHVRDKKCAQNVTSNRVGKTGGQRCMRGIMLNGF
jgi:hypothetical protein